MGSPGRLGCSEQTRLAVVAAHDSICRFKATGGLLNREHAEPDPLADERGAAAPDRSGLHPLQAIVTGPVGLMSTNEGLTQQLEGAPHPRPLYAGMPAKDAAGLPFPPSQSGTGRFLERRNSGLNSFDW